MSQVKCLKDEEGYWKVGETYRYETEGEYLETIRIHDDDDKECEWVLMPTYWDEELKALRYEAAGMNAEFIEVA